MDHGGTIDGAGGRFVIGKSPEVGKMFANTWNCHNYKPYIQQWTGDNSNVHAWGCGLVLDSAKTSKEIGGPGNGYGQCAWSDTNTNVNSAGYPTCKQHMKIDWDSMYVRVKYAPPAPPAVPPPPPSSPVKLNAAGKNTCADHKNNLDPGTAGYTVVFDYHDDRSTDDIPNKKEDIAKGFTTGNAMYIGNNALNALSFSEAEFCMAKARSSPDTECKEWKVTADVTSVPSDVGEGYSSCYVFGDSDFTYTPKTSHDTLGGLVGKTRKLIGAFGGQVARPHPSAPCPLYLPSCAPRCLLLCEPGRTQPQPHSGRALLL